MQIQALFFFNDAKDLRIKKLNPENDLGIVPMLDILIIFKYELQFFYTLYK